VIKEASAAGYKYSFWRLQVVWRRVSAMGRSLCRKRTNIARAVHDYLLVLSCFFLSSCRFTWNCSVSMGRWQVKYSGLFRSHSGI